MKQLAIRDKHTHYASSDCTRQQTEKTANHPLLDCHAPRGVQSMLPFGRGGGRKGGKASEEEQRERKSGECLTSPPPRPDLSFFQCIIIVVLRQGLSCTKFSAVESIEFVLKCSWKNALRVFDLNL